MKKIALPVFIVLIAGLSCSKSDGIMDGAKQISGSVGSMARFAIAGNYLYTVDKTQLKVYSLSDPASPVLKNTTDVGFEIETIYPFRDRLFIGSTSVVHIFSVDNPEKPEKLSTAISPEVLRRCDPVVAKDSVAYATLRANGPCGGFESRLVAYDIRDIANPVQRFQYLLSEPYGLGYADSALYVCDNNSLLVFDINQAYNPSMVTILPGEGFLDVIPYGNTLVCWVSSGMMLYDISDRFRPEFITSIL